MLVLTRKIGESLVIDGDITIKVSQIQGNRVKLCIDAPRSHRVVRAEIQTEEQAPAPMVSRTPTRADASTAVVPMNAK
jgi:carbon storage regulator